ncbi:MAG: NADH-quinone oxidoreductase subunit N [Candidatus Schekmanbacteria bacterium]|nr:NADH-quinone oxidoreductase subunit N [Candidatus Schekmanbacteria bacterium]
MTAQQLWLDTLYILPEIIVTAVALLVFTWDFLRPKEQPVMLAAVSLLGLLIAMMFTVPQWGQEFIVFSKSIAVDYFSICLKFLTLSVTAFVIVISIPYFKKVDMWRGEYFVLLLFACVGILLVGDGISLVTIYLGLELLAIPAYVLTAFMVHDERSSEAAMKYFLMGSLASAIMVYGISLVYGITGQLNIYAIQDYIVKAGVKSDPALLVGVILLIAGFGFKIGAVPFHMWLPDVYEGAPTPITAYIATAAKIAPMAAVLRVFVVAVHPLSGHWMPVMAILSALTMSLGNFLALKQENIKRMLAYSGITHIGYALMGIVAAGVSREMGVVSVVFYFIVYLISNVGAFGVIIYICKEGGRWGDNYNDFKGLAKVSPLAAMVMSIFVMSMLGVPPTGGFMGKIWLFAAAIKTNMIWLAVVGVINAIISAYYYLRVMVMMYMHEPSPELMIEKEGAGLLAFMLFVMAAITVYMGINPGVFYDLAYKSLTTLL